jgi:enterochelin esterase-like enzyme
MKLYRYIILLLAISGFVGCSSDSDEGNSGAFSNTTYCDFNNVTIQPTEKLSNGIKALNTSFTDADGHNMTLCFGSKEWILSENAYTPVTTVSGAGTYAGTINGVTISEGNVYVNIIRETYFISGLLKTSDGKEYRVSYTGPMTFEIGEDDSEPSGYTLFIQTSAVSVFDWSTFASTDYPEVTKYTVTISDPTGKQVALFDVINSNDMKAEQLAGTYQVESYAHEPWRVDAGYSVPDYNMAGGSSYMDVSGNMQYIVGGTIEITTATGTDGNTLYSFKGTSLNSVDIAGAEHAGGSFNITDVSYLEVQGTVVRDLTIDSQILGRQMKYSVYLPDDYDGQTTLPVLYMLHGYGDDQNSWLDKGNLAALTSAAISTGTVGKMIVVTPDAMQTFYCNGVQDGLAYEDYFFNELIPAVEEKYNVGKDKAMRAVGGLSMGGYGTLYYAVQHHDMFCCAYAMSPACYIDGLPSLFDLYPAANIADLPDLTMEVGTEDTTVYSACPLLAGTIQPLGLANFEYIERPGVHDWAFWTGCYPKFMTKLGKYFK